MMINQPKMASVPVALASMRVRHPTFSWKAEGLQWNVIDTGANEAHRNTIPIVMLPGALGTHEIFYQQLAFLEPTYRVILLGYPGSDNTEAMGGGLISVLDRLEIEKGIFVGSSLGACWLQVITASATASLNKRVAHLMLGNTFVDAEPLQGNPLFARSLINEGTPETIHAQFTHFVQNLPACELRTIQLDFLANHQSPEELAGRLGMVANAGRIPTSAVSQERITLLTCEDDAITMGPMGKALRDAYSAAHHVEFSAGGHYPHVNQPGQYNALLKSIIDKC